MDAFNGTHPELFRGYADTNSNGAYDVGVDRYTATANVTAWDEVVRLSGDFIARRGILELAGSGIATMSIPNDFFG